MNCPSRCGNVRECILCMLHWKSTHISHRMMPKAYRSAFCDSLPSLSSSGGICVTCSGAGR